MMVTGNYSATTVCRLLGGSLSDHGGSEGKPQPFAQQRIEGRLLLDHPNVSLSTVRSNKWNHTSPPRVGDGGPPLKGRQIPSFVANDAAAGAQEEAGQNDSLNPTLRGCSSELVSLAYTAVRG
jgi:hypothetical protein